MAGPFGCLLGLLLALVVFCLFLVLTIVRKAKDIFSPFFPHGKKSQSSGTDAGQRGEQPHPHSSSHPSQKIFDDDEGEYVDFEEIK